MILRILIKKWNERWKVEIQATENNQFLGVDTIDWRHPNDQLKI
jgi:hypothetical protein